MAAIGITSDADLKYWRDLGDSPRVTDAVFLLHLRRRESEGASYRRWDGSRAELLGQIDGMDVHVDRI